MAEVGRLANIAETVVHYRVHAGCVSRERAEKQHDSARRAIEDAHRRRGLSLPERVEMWSLEGRRRPAVELQEGRAMSAARNGYGRTARKHALRILSRRPWRVRAWKAHHEHGKRDGG